MNIQDMIDDLHGHSAKVNPKIIYAVMPVAATSPDYIPANRKFTGILEAGVQVAITIRDGKLSYTVHKPLADFNVEGT